MLRFERSQKRKLQNDARNTGKSGRWGHHRRSVSGLGCVLRMTPRETPGLCASLMQFALDMQNRLSANAHKGGWQNEPDAYLLKRLRQELGELTKELNRRDCSPEKVVHEATDVANFAMMIADNWRRKQSRKPIMHWENAGGEAMCSGKPVEASGSPAKVREYDGPVCPICWDKIVRRGLQVPR